MRDNDDDRLNDADAMLVQALLSIAAWAVIIGFIAWLAGWL